MALNLKALHILVVEDIQAMRDLTVAVLKAQGYTKISTATDGKDGFEAFCYGNHDIILTDWCMPVMDGATMVEHIRKSPRSPNKSVPIIMMTGFGSMDKIATARNKGANEFLMKPFSAQDISKRILHTIKSPRDFIVTETFQGPDRRRREASNFTGNVRSEKPDPNKVKIIKANHVLQAKIGMGTVDDESMMRAQSVLDNNKINFEPIASRFLSELKENLEIARQTGATGHRMIEDLTSPVMQIKANARVFKYPLMGDLASIMMNFLDNLKELDSDVLEIVEAHHTTLHHIVQNQLKGDGGVLGDNLHSELENACKRYVNSRAEGLKTRLKTLIEEKEQA